MSDLVAFLRARWDEEAVRATMREIHALNCEQVPNDAGYTYPCDCGVPERMMREVEAKRAILAEHRQGDNDSIWCWRCDPAGGETFSDSDAYYPCKTLRLLAAVWSDHPDYQKDWA